MSGMADEPTDALPILQLLEIDAICARFEAAWKAGQQPKVEDYLAAVTPAERPAAASFTAVPRSLAGALSPTLSGALFAAGWISAPLVACGVLKICYDLALWRSCRGDALEER